MGLSAKKVILVAEWRIKPAPGIAQTMSLGARATGTFLSGTRFRPDDDRGPPMQKCSWAVDDQGIVRSHREKPTNFTALEVLSSAHVNDPAAVHYVHDICQVAAEVEILLDEQYGHAGGIA